ncbi:hypothetical protein RB614_43210 [Phytohabitans sp. ZYX-F-186]|uniref:Uncharacterized protein n=1 Tax=Phytohabitans maris TaxID=3071409 RepID=A0ABU0ZWL4_9ACTN|nr:aroma-sacti cluster domain-containing protein [Phytohabitans sp. ZYX-F-186]MDQ7911320.1 hypothetical protein [Phytohabitans sp. ZYX-F-186]
MTAQPPEPLSALLAAGFPVAAFSEQERAVFAALSPAEVALLVDIKGRLDAMAPDVQAHSVIAGAALF